MANFCDFEVRVKGSRNACYMVYWSMPSTDENDIVDEEDDGNSYQLDFTGQCKWSVNYGVVDKLKRVNVDSMSEEEIEEKCGDYWDYSLRAKSEAFQCEIMVHYWSEESGFDQFDHYKNGKALKKRKIEYDYDEGNEFDWDELEFVGHEGEYDESVNGEENDALFMAMLTNAADAAFGQSQYDTDEDADVNQYDTDVDDDEEASQEQINYLMGALGDILNNLEEAAEEKGVDLSKGVIEGTDFDMYNWTFTEGNVAKGNGWTIAIPDGFVQIKSKECEPVTGKKRLFELVPVAYKNEKDPDKIPIRILPGGLSDYESMKEYWLVHPDARSGIFGTVGVSAAKYFGQVMGKMPELFYMAWEDLAGYVIIQETSFRNYSYQCTTIMENNNQQFKVDAANVRGKQKEILNKSVETWIKTMRLDKPNKLCSKKTKFEEKACLDSLLSGKTNKFDEAVEQAEIEYKVAIDLKFGVFEYLDENGFVKNHEESYISNILEEAMKVRLFFLEKADQLIDRLKEKSVKKSFIDKLIKKLSALDNDCLEVSYGRKKIKISVPKEVQSIRDKWKGIPPEEEISVSDGDLVNADFTVSENIDSLRKFVENFEQSWKYTLKTKNDEILNEKQTPITRANDSRIKKMTVNSQEVILQYASKLQDVMVELDKIGENKRSEGAPEIEIKDICDLISACFEKLHISTTIQIYKEKKTFKHTIASSYSNISRKWKKIYKSLPCAKIQDLQEDLAEKQVNLDEIKKKITSDKRQRTKLGKKVEEAEQALATAKEPYENSDLKAVEEKYTADISVVESELSRLQTELQSAEDNVSEYEKKINILENDYKTKADPFQKEKKALKDKLQELKVKRNPIVDEEAKCNYEAKKAFFFKKKKEQAHVVVLGRLNVIDKEIAECEGKITIVSDELVEIEKARYQDTNEIINDLSPWKDKVKELKASIKDNKNSKKSLDKDFKENKAAINKYKREIKAAQKDLDSINKEFSTIDGAITKLESERDALLKDISDIEKQISEIKAESQGFTEG